MKRHELFDYVHRWVTLVLGYVLLLAFFSFIAFWNYRTQHWIAAFVSAAIVGVALWAIVKHIRAGLPEQRHFTGRYTAGSTISTKHKPTARALVIACWACFVVTYLGFHTTFVARWGIGSREVLEGHEWWRLVTSPFLHAFPMHIIMNMSALLALGTWIEGLLGGRKLLVIYGAAAIGGGLGVIASGQENVVGASGAIYGLVGALLALGVRAHRVEAKKTAQSYLRAGGVMLALNLAFTLAIPFISLPAHLGGTLFGFLIVLWLPLSSDLVDLWLLVEHLPGVNAMSYDRDAKLVLYSGPARTALEWGLVATTDWVSAADSETMPPFAPLHELDLDHVIVSCYVPVDTFSAAAEGSLSAPHVHGYA